MITYKVASVRNATPLHRYFSLFRTHYPINTLEYKIGEPTYPRYGYIFTYTALEDAEQYNYFCPTVILEGEAEDTFQVGEDFKMLPISYVNDTALLKTFWNSVQAEHYSISDTITLCKKFTPLRVLGYKPGMTPYP
jgi:hypothetical protein